MNTVQVQAKLEPIWSTVRNIRSKLKEELAGHPAAVRNATAMVASELLENAIKYGEAVPTAPEIAFIFTLSEEELRIVVANGAYGGRNVQRLQQHVAALKDAENRVALYTARLQALLAEPNQVTGLGIYRIGLEGGYELECTYENNVVTVIATRSCHGR